MASPDTHHAISTVYDSDWSQGKGKAFTDSGHLIGDGDGAHNQNIVFDTGRMIRRNAAAPIMQSDVEAVYEDNFDDFVPSCPVAALPMGAALESFRLDAGEHHGSDLMKSDLCEEDPFELFKLDREMTLQPDGHMVGTIEVSHSLQCDTSDAQLPTPDITMRATLDEASKAADINVVRIEELCRRGKALRGYPEWHEESEQLLAYIIASSTPCLDTG